MHCVLIRAYFPVAEPRKWGFKPAAWWLLWPSLRHFWLPILRPANGSSEKLIVGKCPEEAGLVKKERIILNPD